MLTPRWVGAINNLKKIAGYHKPLEGRLEVHVNIPMRAGVFMVCEGTSQIMREGFPFGLR
jgi:hypothetical protein